MQRNFVLIDFNFQEFNAFPDFKPVTGFLTLKGSSFPSAPSSIFWETVIIHSYHFHPLRLVKFISMNIQSCLFRALRDFTEPI